MSDEKPTVEYVTLPTGGSIPGIPGTHAPGRYTIDWLERTLTPVVDAVEQVAEAIKNPKKVAAPVEPAPADAPTSEQAE